MIQSHEFSTVKYIKSWPDCHLLVHIGLYTATKKDLHCLLHSSDYLNDEVSTTQHTYVLFQHLHQTGFHLPKQVMNAYIRILKAKPGIQQRKDGDAYLETTYNATKIRQDTAASLKDKGERSFSLSQTLKYLNHELVLDSMGTTSKRPELRKLLEGLQNRVNRLEELKLIKKHKWTNTQVDKWRLINCIPDAMQFDSSSCGLFTLKFMELWTGNILSSTFTQKDMINFRLKLAVILVNYPWNKVKGSPGYKPSNVEETYRLEHNEKKQNNNSLL
ncbi:unnamed protein product [Urochloa decumbens]|uniref:Ubiquitin-like protease family profile domain-containing protein n=1 Tax=Urochloa decumbens TaxID=240449 RepID=A0ABC9GJN3_9POAL